MAKSLPQPDARTSREVKSESDASANSAMPVSDMKAVQRKIDPLSAMAAAMPDNAHKAAEHHGQAATGAVGATPAGETVAPPASYTTASTLSEAHHSEKTGAAVMDGTEAMSGELGRVRTDAGGHRLTTNQGVPVADNQNSLKLGLRGPALLEDFILREKLTHFDHERIPERIIHARGSGAHGVFECLDPITSLTRAAPFRGAGKRAPVFVRFSTVVGEKGSKDTARDARGFAVKFYTGISPRFPNGEPDPGVVWVKQDVEAAMDANTQVIARRQHPEREQIFMQSP